MMTIKKRDDMKKGTVAESAFSKLMQVGVVVRDMDKAVERLSSLGIGPFKRILLPPDRQEWFRGKPRKPIKENVKINIAMMGGLEIELIEPGEGESPHKEFLASKGEGIQHIAFAVDDLDKEVFKLTNQGAKELLRTKWQGGGIAYFDLGAGGLIIELIQRQWKT
jgi:methylmalonyl-CoA/ethylmalonyl-CoA epimerase